MHKGAYAPKILGSIARTSSLLACFVVAGVGCAEGERDTEDDALYVDDADENASVGEALTEAGFNKLPCNQDKASPNVNAKLVLTYGFLRDNQGKYVSSDMGPFYALSHAGLGEVVITSSLMGDGACASTPGGESAPSPAFNGFRRQGGLVARSLPLQWFRNSFKAVGGQSKGMDGRTPAAGKLITMLQHGFAYITIDELDPNEDADFYDGTPLSRAMSAMLDELAGAGYDRRVILYLPSYGSRGMHGRVKDTLTAFKEHGRAVAPEVYLSPAAALDGRAAKPTGRYCTALSCIDSLSAEIESVAPGIGPRILTTLRVSHEGSDLSAGEICRAYQAQFAWLSKPHTSMQRGVRLFSLSQVTLPGTPVRASVIGEDGQPRLPVREYVSSPERRARARCLAAAARARLSQ